MRQIEPLNRRRRTVLDIEILRKRLTPSASFIVTPVLVKDVVSCALKERFRFSPRLARGRYDCWQSGATMVKVFGRVTGPKYFREIKAVSRRRAALFAEGLPRNIWRNILAGVSAVAFGASVFRKEWLEKSDFKNIEKSIKKFLVK